MGLIGKFSAFILVISLTFSGTFSPFSADFYKILFGKDAQYAYVMVAGLGGWGDSSDINGILPYWGATTGSLKKYMATKDYDVYEASVGPFSSCWDRACELYAQLTGTTVDYGEAHSTENNHERYGRTYAEPLFENWGEVDEDGNIVKVNLVGHSFGGPTVRLLTHLLEYGASEEVKASGEDVSPLFAGGKGNWVNSVTTLCSPNNGTSLVYSLEKGNSCNPIDFLVNFFLAVGGVSGNTIANRFWDFQLEQFGITQIPGEPTNCSEIIGALNRLCDMGTDQAIYDLSFAGAAELNERIELVDDVFYFSYAVCTTQKSSINDNQVPKRDNMSILKISERSMGKYSGHNVDGVEVDETWLANDGLVNVVSARYPFDEAHQDYNAKDVKKGIWNVMPVIEGDHGTIIGLYADTRETHKFYIKLFTMVDFFTKVDFFKSK